MISFGILKVSKHIERSKLLCAEPHHIDSHWILIQEFEEYVKIRGISENVWFLSDYGKSPKTLIFQ